MTTLKARGAAVVSVNRLIQHIGPGTINRQHLAEAVVGVGPNSSAAGRCICDRLRQQVAVRIIGKPRAPVRLRNERRETKRRMPTRADRACF